MNGKHATNEQADKAGLEKTGPRLLPGAAAKGAHGHSSLPGSCTWLYMSSVTTNRWFSHLLTEPSQPRTKHLSKLHLLSKRGVPPFSHQLKYSKTNQQASKQNKYTTTTITKSKKIGSKIWKPPPPQLMELKHPPIEINWATQNQGSTPWIKPEKTDGVGRKPMAT